ncbi:MAG: metallophosphoesterase [Deltaproteobacteria bacterium]|nr:metallophosphoesterase [Deltaproteobacteria bacterium]
MLSRRQFLKGTLAVGTASFVADGIFFEPRHVIVEKKTVAINNLPDGFEGFKICQITDVHHSSFVGLGFIEKVVDKANSLKPDLVVLTGDYIDGSRKYIMPAVSALCKLNAPYGALAVLGNHDHWEDAELTKDGFSKYHIPVITNEHRFIEIKDSAICIAGVGDFMEGTQDLKAAFHGVSHDIPRILLSHNPDYAEVMPETERVDLVLSGHTHGGQIKIPFSIAPVTMSRYGQKYIGGLVKLATTQVYVSRGIGVVGLPIRFNCPPELTLLTLTKAVHKV